MQKRRERIEKWRHDRKMQEIAQAKSDLGIVWITLLLVLLAGKFFFN